VPGELKEVSVSIGTESSGERSIVQIDFVVCWQAGMCGAEGRRVTNCWHRDKRRGASALEPCDEPGSWTAELLQPAQACMYIVVYFFSQNFLIKSKLLKTL
jgi:hypothetical protein